MSPLPSHRSYNQQFHSNSDNSSINDFCFRLLKSPCECGCHWLMMNERGWVGGHAWFLGTHTQAEYTGRKMLKSDISTQEDNSSGWVNLWSPAQSLQLISVCVSVLKSLCKKSVQLTAAGKGNLCLPTKCSVYKIRERLGGQDVAVSGPFDDEWEDVTCSILSPGCRAEAAGPSCCTLVTKIPYKSKWYTVRTTQGHDGLESLPFSFSSQYPPPPPKNHISAENIREVHQCFLFVLNLERHAVHDDIILVI